MSYVTMSWSNLKYKYEKNGGVINYLICNVMVQHEIENKNK